MSEHLLKIIAGILFSLWLLIVLPGWVLGMLYAGEIILLPPMDLGGIEWAAFLAGMYVPPILTGIAIYRILLAKRQKRNA